MDIQDLLSRLAVALGIGLLVVAAVGSNTVSKIVIGAVVGRGWFAVDIAVFGAAAAATGAVALWLALMFAQAA